MKIKAVQFDDNETPVLASFKVSDDEVRTITETLGRDVSAGTVHLTIPDAATLARTYGKLNGHTGTEQTSDIYFCLTGTLFNVYWENGIEDVDGGE